MSKVVENDLDAFAKPDARPEPAADAKPVRVSLKKGKVRSYDGYVRPSSDDRVLVLDLLDADGVVRILRSDIDTIEEQDGNTGPKPAIEPGELRSIDTTHVVYLRNGNKLLGNVVETSAEEPLKLSVGPYGIMTVRRADIVDVKEEAGKIEIPAAPTRAATTRKRRAERRARGDKSIPNARCATRSARR